MKLKNSILMVLMAVTTNVVAAIEVSDVTVFSGHPWKEVVVGYTITGTAAETDIDTDIINLTATDKSANKTYSAEWRTDEVLTKGRHVLRWNAAAEGIKFSSSNVVFSVSIVRQSGVQLWEDGPYWAGCNVGATKPEEYGYYFQWGDTTGCKRNARNDEWVTAKNYKSVSLSSNRSETHRRSDSELQLAGYIDTTGNLVAAYDAATVHLGAPWRMPTEEEFDALRANCTTTWTKRNGVAGRLVMGKGAYSSRSIFLPAAGYGYNSYLDDLGSDGYYWSSTRDSSSSYIACFLHVDSSYIYRGNIGYRFYGYPVRPVRGFAK